MFEGCPKQTAFEDRGIFPPNNAAPSQDGAALCFVGCGKISARAEIEPP